MSKVIGYVFYIVFYQHGFYLFLKRKWSLTSNIEQSFMTVACVSNVRGNTTKNPSVWLLHSCYLQDAHGQKGVPGWDRQKEEYEWEEITVSKRYLFKKIKIWVMSHHSTFHLMCWWPFYLSPRWCWPLEYCSPGIENVPHLLHPPSWTLDECET